MLKRARVESARTDVGKGIEVCAQSKESRLWIRWLCAPEAAISVHFINDTGQYRNSVHSPFRPPSTAKQYSV